jgi:hypothetical protein
MLSCMFVLVRLDKVTSATGLGISVAFVKSKLLLAGLFIVTVVGTPATTELFAVNSVVGAVGEFATTRNLAFAAGIFTPTTTSRDR